MTKRFKSNNNVELRKIIARFLFSDISDTLAGMKIKNDITKLRALFDGLGFRTTIIESPRQAMSVYLDSCECNACSPKAFLSTMIGMNPMQADLERLYGKSVRDTWCLMLFCKRIKEACNVVVNEAKFGGNDLHKILDETIRSCKSFINEDIIPLPFNQRERIIEIQKMAEAVDDRVRLDQLEREFDRIQACNSTLSNAMARLLFDFHESDVKDVVFKQSHMPQYQRLSFYLYDPDIDEVKPSQFLFLPCLHKLLMKGYKEIVNLMADTFWKEMLQRGYFASASARAAIEPSLKRYIESGLTKNPSVPMLV